jgi:two-component system, CitB family, sensor kinase
VKNRLPLAYRIIGLQIAIVVAAALGGVATIVWQAREQLDAQYEARSLSIAQTVAEMAQIQDAAASGSTSAALQQTAERIRRSTGASYIVITDRHGIRLTHPNRTLIGRRVDEDPSAVLAGHTWVGVQRGTIGLAARGKTPIFRNGAVVGMVSVGYPDQIVAGQLLTYVPGFALAALCALLLGVVGSLLLARHVKRQIFGLEPYEIAGLLEEREASLQGIREGAIATADDGTITLANQEAQRLLGIGPEAVGRKLGQVIPPSRLLRFMAGELRDEDELVLSGPRVLVASRRPVQVRGHDIGHVVTFRDASDLVQLSEGIGVDGLTDALRAQAHEFSNRLHAIAGLFELGRSEEAMRLITETSGLHQELSEALLDRVGDPVLGALLLAKSATATERGIDFRVAETAMPPGSPLDGDELITVAGNLIDNAIDAAGRSSGRRAVTVSVGSEAGELAIKVEDSGPGVPAELRGEIFVEGFTTKRAADRRHRGLGLALARQIVARHHGSLRVERSPSELGGAVFVARMPLRAEVPS